MLRAAPFPIGIDVDEFIELGNGPAAQHTLATMREQYARRRLVVGVDRLDYSKGLPQRIRAFAPCSNATRRTETARR